LIADYYTGLACTQILLAISSNGAYGFTFVALGGVFYLVINQANAVFDGRPIPLPLVVHLVPGTLSQPFLRHYSNLGLNLWTSC